MVPYNIYKTEDNVVAILQSECDSLMKSCKEDPYYLDCNGCCRNSVKQVIFVHYNYFSPTLLFEIHMLRMLSLICFIKHIEVMHYFKYRLNNSAGFKDHRI